MTDTLDGPITIMIPPGESFDLHNDQHMELVKRVLTWVQNECWQTAEDSGWHGNETLPEKMLLWHSEVTEAAEELRNGRPADLMYYSYKAGDKVITTDRPAREVMKAGKSTMVLNKPEGVASEVADIFVRIADDSQRYGVPWIESLIEKMRFNKTRPRRHGGKTF